jgi:hypothetical protein
MVADMNLNPFAKKDLLNTTVEVMCQTTGRTFRITSNKSRKQCRCHWCGDSSGSSEAFLMELGEGQGNVTVTYYGMDGSVRKLDKIVPDVLADNRHGHMGLAGYSATGGTFILVSQEKV